VDAWGIFVPAVLAFLWLRFIRRRFATSSRASGYKRIKSWIKQRYGLSFARETDPGSIRMQLESVLSREMMRLTSDYESRRDYYEAERKKKRWRKPFNAEKRLLGFKAFIERQDYSIFVE